MNLEYATTRITKITIDNFKNVKHGAVELENKRKAYDASILGIYGQNGSGKTSIIEALAILKTCLCGLPLQQRIVENISVDAEYSKFSFDFLVNVLNNVEINASYEFKVRSMQRYGEGNLSLGNDQEIIPEIYDEVLTASYKTKNEERRKMVIINTDTKAVFKPESKYDSIIGKDKNVYENLILAKKMASVSSRSFIFSREMTNAVDQRFKDYENLITTDVSYYLLLLRTLMHYGNSRLFVIGTNYSGFISLNNLPLIYKIKTGDQKLAYEISSKMINLEKTNKLSMDEYLNFNNSIKSINVVLEQIVPGLTIGIKKLSDTILEDGNKGVNVMLMSYKNEKEIALMYESEGIKKIICILQLLINVYNNKGITVAIDELDAGIFEYLLGEILNVISEKAKGQLIFTSHNLRPLETIDRGFIVFTTTDPNNRYMRMPNVKSNNNLRDYYFREIMLGDDDKKLYNKTDDAELAFAFKEAELMNE